MVFIVNTRVKFVPFRVSTKYVTEQVQIPTSCGFLNALITNLFVYDRSVLQRAILSNLPFYTL